MVSRTRGHDSENMQVTPITAVCSGMRAFISIVQTQRNAGRVRNSAAAPPTASMIWTSKLASSSAAAR
jgi:hypothetical protein